jgi:hypothetical protein
MDHFSTRYINDITIFNEILYYLLNIIELQYIFIFIIYILIPMFSLTNIILKRIVSDYNIIITFTLGLFPNETCVKEECDQFIIYK